ncbi:hypothetical protein GNI_025150 [Gregarina niphandrodes]|uniref:Uncharacterized protein n=1 Tax=Gregarina niphandrodes TaxID=110365 RepID=A0A023BBD4_GRENI|nr:hypothetical protein GNI_025150 [Gregarina niphandrodes]EZG79586.1 hypothetical protein GNI_025150 [Gregarina niphandrodes]|eukprot:XP_011134410.1 hypothetical protein GNI_025150 [Gregarina niphandrodes]
MDNITPTKPKVLTVSASQLLLRDIKDSYDWLASRKSVDVRSLKAFEKMLVNGIELIKSSLNNVNATIETKAKKKIKAEEEHQEFIKILEQCQQDQQTQLVQLNKQLQIGLQHSDHLATKYQDRWSVGPIIVNKLRECEHLTALACQDFLEGLE